MRDSLTIGRLAQAAGVNVETIRYYQRIGLIAEPPRPATGFRRYPPSTIGRIRFIRRARELGFRLREIRELLDLGEARCSDVKARAQAKRNQVARQIADLQALQATLDHLIQACEADAHGARCPIVESLLGKD